MKDDILFALTMFGIACTFVGYGGEWLMRWVAP